MNGKIENDDGEEVSITILVNKDNSVRSAAAKIIAKDLSNVGFSVTLDSKDWDEASYDLRDFFDGDTLWEYTNNDILEKASQLEELHDASEYTKIYEELKDMMLDELPYYALCYRKMGLMGIEYFEAGQLPTFDDIYKNCNTWTWKRIKED